MTMEACIRAMSDEEREELVGLGVLSPEGGLVPSEPPRVKEGYTNVAKKAVRAPEVLNEAYAYPLPSSFSRGLRLEFGPVSVIVISGTASVDERGVSVYPGDFRAQCWRTYRNISQLLSAEGASWHDIVKTTCYLRDIERDYDDFNRVRTAFFEWLELDPLPASVGIQARLCRSDLLVEIEAIAIVQKAD